MAVELVGEPAVVGPRMLKPNGADDVNPDVLAAERDNRRDRCDEAREGVDKLAEIWAEVEGCVKTALVGLELVRFSPLLASIFAHDFFNSIRRGDKSSLGPIRKVPHQELLLPVNWI